MPHGTIAQRSSETPYTHGKVLQGLGYHAEPQEIKKHTVWHGQFGTGTGLPSLQLDGKELDWVESWTYLGVTILSHKTFNCCIAEKVSNFYRSANAIL